MLQTNLIMAPLVIGPGWTDWQGILPETLMTILSIGDRS